MSKNGFSYYKAETDRFQDIKIKRLKKKYGCDGYAVYQYALNEIYRVDGSYIRWTEDQLFDCADYWSLNEARVKEIICYCAEICLFDPVIWKTQCILTSRAIQSRYLDICKVSKKKSYIPLGILLVEPEQQIKEVSTMPLFDTDAVSKNEQNVPILPISPQEETEIIPEILRSIPETLRNAQETSGNIPEKSDKEKKNKEKQSKEKSSSTPPLPSGTLTEEEAKSLLSSTVLGHSTNSNKPAAIGQQPPQAEAEARAQKPRNAKGLIESLRPYNLSPKELEEVLILSGHGEIGNPVWGIIGEMHGNKRLKMPRLFLLKRLRDAVGLVVKATESPDVQNKTAS
ncbi:MAG TPA: DUF4373 domain-containing protein [Bacteroides thetaiotaomicron]|jgi:Sec-independent protein translocase protein TatA|nr:DUF4373 domain-containing protein [Bacteroides thetaiotaomicron]